MRLRGSVTLFLALAATTVSALLLALTESARTAGARFYVENMADSAAASLFSQYHSGLWENYRLLGYHCFSDADAAAELLRFLEPYAENCGFYAVADPEVSVTETTCLTDEGGRWFEQEITDYLSCGWISLGYTPADAASLLKQIKEAKTMDGILKDYGLRSREAVKMEKALSKVRENLDRQEELKRTAWREVRNGNNWAFQRTGEKLENTKKKLPGLVEDYDKKADQFHQKLLEVEEAHREDMESLEEVNRKAIEEQIAGFHSYTDQDGERRVEIDALPASLDEELSTISSVRAFADETQDYIDSFDDDDEEDGPDIDEDALWAEVAEAWDGVGIPSMTVSHGIRNEETEGLLEAVLSLASKGFLHIVLPPDSTVSSTKIDRSQFPSKTSVTPRSDGGPSLVTALAVDAYAARYLHAFPDRIARPVALELEYAAAGKDTDLQNLTQVLGEVFAIREALNFLHIMTDSELKAEASAIAQTIGAVTMVPGLALLVECLGHQGVLHGPPAAPGGETGRLFQVPGRLDDRPRGRAGLRRLPAPAGGKAEGLLPGAELRGLPDDPPLSPGLRDPELPDHGHGADEPGGDRPPLPHEPLRLRPARGGADRIPPPVHHKRALCRPARHPPGALRDQRQNRPRLLTAGPPV